MKKPKFEAAYAFSLLKGEADDLKKLEKTRFQWAAWKNHHWPADVVRPGLRAYGFDKQHRALRVLFEVTKGGSFQYASRSDFEEHVHRITGWWPLDDDPYFERFPKPPRGKKYWGLALRWKVIRPVEIPFRGRFNQLGWQKLDAPVRLVVGNDIDQAYKEGGAKMRSHLVYERNPALRAAAIELWREKQKGRIRCSICSFDFLREYGDLGSNYIEMHHLLPLAEAKKRKTKPGDLVPLCSNCHRVAHRQYPPYTIGELKAARRRAKRT